MKSSYKFFFIIIAFFQLGSSTCQRRSGGGTGELLPGDINVPSRGQPEWLLARAQGKEVEIPNCSEGQAPSSRNIDDVKAVSQFLLQPIWETRHPVEGKKWTAQVYRALEESGQALLENPPPRRIEEFCPSYRKLDRDGRKNFWLYFISGLSEIESSCNPNSYYKESNGRYSVGLLQLSTSDRRGYKHRDCQFKSDQDIEEPARNLRCGVYIMNHLVRRDGVLYGGNGSSSKGLGAYWAPMRESSWGGDTNNIRELKVLTRAIPECRKAI